MDWKRWFPHETESRAKQQVAGPAWLADVDLLCSLHQSLDLCREAMTAGEAWAGSLKCVLPSMRSLLDARAAAVRVKWPSEILFHVSAKDHATEQGLLNHFSFVRLCELLMSSPQPIVLTDPLAGEVFVDPLLRSLFPKLSVLTTAWLIPGGEIGWAFFSPAPSHFNREHLAVLDYFGAFLLSSHLESSNEDLFSFAQMG